MGTARKIIEAFQLAEEDELKLVYDAETGLIKPEARPGALESPQPHRAVAALELPDNIQD